MRRLHALNKKQNKKKNLSSPQGGGVESHNPAGSEQHLQETSNNITGAAAHAPKFLPELNIGQVYIAGDSLI